MKILTQYWRTSLANFDKKMNKILDQVKKTIEKFNDGGPHVKELADWMVDKIRTRTRLGYGVSKHKGSKEKLAPLKDSTIASRKRKRKAGKLSSLTSPKKSNLTETQQMLDDLDYKISKRRITYKFKSSLSKKKEAWANDGSSNRAPRPYLNLSDKEYNQAAKILKQLIFAEVNKKLKLLK